MSCGVLYSAVKISVLQLYVSIWMNVINIVEKKEALEKKDTCKYFLTYVKFKSWLD